MDMEESFSWIPYSDQDNHKLNQAFEAKQPSCYVCNDRFRIEFDKEGALAGNQYACNIPDPVNRMVVCAEPENDGKIHGMEVGKESK
eukprot:UN11325